MPRNYLVNGSYHYVIRGFVEADPNLPLPAGPIVPNAPKLPPSALDAWAGPWQGAQTHRTGWYPYFSMGFLTFDSTNLSFDTGTGAQRWVVLTGQSLVVSMGGNAVLASPSFDSASNYSVDDNGRSGTGELYVTHTDQVQHMLKFRFAIVDDAQRLDFVITESRPRRTAAAGEMVRYSRPSFANWLFRLRS
jgi:hypothetical protein